VVSVERHFAAKQLADGSVLASDLSASGDPSVHLSTWRGRIREEIATLLPMLEYVSFRVHVPGTYDLTPDRQMIVGPVEGLPGLVLAAGMSGRGFMMAPAVARLVADALAGAADSLPEAVALSRFEKQALAPESQVV
jgi:sarcosine oxidase subunit beta